MLALEAAKANGATLPLDVLLAPAIGQARNGYTVSRSQARLTQEHLVALAPVPDFAETFLVDGKPPEVGAILRQEALAETLAHLAHAGLDDFYRGDVGREIAADLMRIRAPVTREDLTAYLAKWRDPLSIRLKDAKLFNTPPPTQGLASLMILGLLERLNAPSADNFDYFHGLIEAAGCALAARDRICTDFDDLAPDWADVLSRQSLDREAAAISRSKASVCLLYTSDAADE